MKLEKSHTGNHVAIPCTENEVEVELATTTTTTKSSLAPNYFKTPVKGSSRALIDLLIFTDTPKEDVRTKMREVRSQSPNDIHIELSPTKDNKMFESPERANGSPALEEPSSNESNVTPLTIILNDKRFDDKSKTTRS